MKENGSDSKKSNGVRKRTGKAMPGSAKGITRISPRRGAHDITGRKHTGEALFENENRYRLLFENMAEGFAYCRMLFDEGRPQDFIYLEVNDSFRRLTGLKDVVGKRVSDVIPGFRETDQEVLEIYGRVALTGQHERFETYVKALGMWFSVSAYCPKKEHFVALFDVITERKLVEEELRGSRQRLLDIISFLPEATFIIDKEGNVIAWNRAMETLTGVKSEEIMGKGNYEYSLPFYGKRIPILIDLVLIHDLEREKHYVNIQRMGDTIFGETYAPNLPRGGRYLSGTASVLRKADGEIIAAIECVRDITERRILQEELSRSEKQYRNLVDNAPIGVYQVNVDGKMIFVNQAYAKIINYESVSDVMTINAIQLYKEPGERKQFLDAIRKDGVVRNYEVEMVGRKGRTINVLINGVLEGDTISGTLVDITERKHAEEILKRYELLSANSRDIILFMRRDNGRIIEANVAAEKAYGYSREELLTLNIHVLRAAHTKESTADQMAEAYSKGLLFETVHRRRDGSTFPVEVSSQGSTIGGIQTLISVVRDITERKRAEEALRKSDEQYRRMFNNLHATMLLIDPETADIVDANPSACRYYGYDIEDLRTKKITDINILSPEQIFEEMARAKAEQRNHFYFQHRLASGEIRPVDVYSGPIEIRDRTLLFSIVHDISERKKAEEEREILICELQEYLSKIKTLRGLLPICASCKNIRNDKGYWEQIEVYIRDHTEVEFSHSVCPECAKKLYPGIIKD